MSFYQQLDKQSAIIALWYVVNASLTAFYKLTHQFTTPKSALEQAVDKWQALGVHQAHIKRWQEVDDVQAFLAKTTHDQQLGMYGVLFLDDECYPALLKEIYDPPPLLFYRGNVHRLQDKQIAVVGSRQPTDFAETMTFNMAQYLAYHGLTVTSGLAGGVDKSAHLGALAGSAGRTVGVMGTGIDVCYPKNHHALYAKIIHEGGCLISEFLPSTPASKHTFPRRNRLVAGLSQATLVTEATMESGSLITARLTAEQGKQVFAVPSRIDNPNAEGCHHLIREGATLIYHPKQIVEELGEYVGIENALPKTFSKGVSVLDDAEPKPTAVDKMVIPEHLSSVFGQLSQNPVDLDTLVVQTGENVATLLASLMELEILGVVKTVGGRYVAQ